MRIPYGFNLTEAGALEVQESAANVVQLIFDYYLAGASLGKIVDMLFSKQILSPTGKAILTMTERVHLERQLAMFLPLSFNYNSCSIFLQYLLQ